MIGEVLLILFIATVIVHLLYVMVLSEFVKKTNHLPEETGPAISVVICSRNDLAELKTNLNSILEQDYHDFEVVVIDDHSSDKTYEWLLDQAVEHYQLKPLRASEGIKDFVGKKKALLEAIEHAGNEHVLLTDADCRAASPYWIRHMAGGFNSKKKIVLGIGRYMDQEKSWHQLMDFETFQTAFQYIGYAGAGMPYMGVGRNLAYEKNLLTKNGMKDHLDLPGGDDDLFVQSVANGSNTIPVIHQEAHTISSRPETFNDWLIQRTRHFSAGFRYRKSLVLLLSIFKLTAALVTPLFLCLLCIHENHLWITLVFTLRWFLIVQLYQSMAVHLGFRISFYLLPWFELFFAFFDLWVLMRNTWIRPGTWK